MLKNRLIKILAFPIFGTFFALLVIEFFLNITKIIPKVPHFTRQSEVLGFEHVPEAQDVYKSSEYSIKVLINNQGFRNDTDVQFNKQEDTKRIVLVGDSFVEGLQVDLDKTVAKKLEAFLNSNQIDIKYEVLNFGVSGYGLDQKFLYLKNNVLAFQPNLVILFFASNDLDDIKNNNIMFLDNNETLQFKQFKKDDKYLVLTKDLVRKFYIPNAIFRIFKTNNKIENGTKKIPIEHKLYQGILDNQTSFYLDLTKRLILESKKITEESGSTFLLVLGVDKTQVVNSYSKSFIDQYNVTNFDSDFINQYLGNFVQENSIEYIDLLPSFKQVGNPTDLFFIKDGHRSQYGHEVVAKVLKTKIDNMEEKACNN